MQPVPGLSDEQQVFAVPAPAHLLHQRQHPVSQRNSPAVSALRRLDVVWELRDDLTVYDACYVVLAEMLDAELVTSDVRLARAPGLRCAVDVLTD
jgi:hypothetical protein